MKNRRTQSALLVAGAAAAAVAATWMGRRRLRAVATPSELAGSRALEPDGLENAGLVDLEKTGIIERATLIEPESAELPVGRSADPDIDHALSRQHLPQDDTSGGALLGDVHSRSERDTSDASLEDVWNAMPGLVGGEQTEGYDAVDPEDLGAVWLERATQTTHEQRPQASDPNEVPDLNALVMSEASRTSAQAPDEVVHDDDDDAIAEDELDLEDDARDRPDR